MSASTCPPLSTNTPTTTSTNSNSSNSNSNNSSTTGPVAAQQQYCLKWNNHQSNLLRAFDRLLHSEAFTDVTLAAEGRSLRAHKVRASLGT
ncbi:hypothetical protein HAZT_HAZT011421 [Hyalella azteca]|uniref:BTB domain-containing protein n=1 Tax=Hyalella azteca TaxID=294128 RepID=A0A6A0H0W7_HYAAZ|nr:hypothetical protein HAZT_HAZT011421 [Hyalella azteca]